VERSAYLAPDRKHNVSIPRTSLQSKASRLALAATGAAAAVAVLVSGGVAVAGGGPAASWPPAAVQGSAAVNRIQPDGQHRPATHRKPAGRPRLSFGDRLAAVARGTASRRPGQHAAAAHRGHTAPAHARSAPARHARACTDSTLRWWICHAERVLERHGTRHGQLSTSAAYIVVEHESGGNPHASNGWDINAAQGHPSEGIAQVIGPTFHAYKLHGYGDIWNPVDNMIAAFRYAISRYGSMNNIPGVVAVRQGGSYIGY
jgi:hypothetical protein